jgi:hypothetical protein
MYHVVICKKEYQGRFDSKSTVVFKADEVYQAEDRGEEYRVWRSKRSFLKFSPSRFIKYFEIFC